MVTIYTEAGNLQCKKAVKWLIENEVKYKEIKVNKKPLTKIELLEIVSLTENGLEDILSRMGREAELEKSLLNEALDILVQVPHFVKKPILYNGKIIQSGYNETEIRAFIPREQREHYYVGI